MGPIKSAGKGKIFTGEKLSEFIGACKRGIELRLSGKSVLSREDAIESAGL